MDERERFSRTNGFSLAFGRWQTRFGFVMRWFACCLLRMSAFLFPDRIGRSVYRSLPLDEREKGADCTGQASLSRWTGTREEERAGERSRALKLEWESSVFFFFFVFDS